MAALGTKRAEQRRPRKTFYGWAVIAVRDAGSGRRWVEATPTADNPYHADIFLNVVETELRDHQKAQALELAELSHDRFNPANRPAASCTPATSATLRKPAHWATA